MTPPGALHARILAATSAATLIAVMFPGISPGAASAATRSCGGRAATIVGTDGDDTISGTDGNDVIVAGTGNDVVRAGPGDDLVCGNQGSDLLIGGSGNDRVFGQMDGIGHDHSSEVLYGDALHGGPGDDYLDVGSDDRDLDDYGDEVSWAGSRTGIHLDLAAGTATGEGHDTIVTRAGSNFVGTTHDDVLMGSATGDDIQGGPGDDTIDGRGSGDQLTAEYAQYDIDAPPPFEDPARGGPQPDDEDVVNGGDGNDTIVSRSGRDVVHGEAGSDELLPFGDSGQFYGDSDDDQMYLPLTRRSGFVVDAGTGNDDLYAEVDAGPGEQTPHASLDLGAGTLGVRWSSGTLTARVVGVERVSLGRNASWSVIGSAGDDVIEGNETFEPLHASMRGGDDTVDGTQVDDDINAGPGDDTVAGNDGFDTCTNAEHTSSCEAP